MSDPKIYPDWESAQEAMDRGETVRIEMGPFKIDPALVQLALDLQAKERMEEWRKTLKNQDYSLGDRVMRRSGMYESEGVVKRVTPTHVDVHWFDSGRTTTIRKDRIKLAPKGEKQG
jgi:transcription antitermination factor NusG